MAKDIRCRLRLELQAALAVGASFSHLARVEGSGRTVLACPDLQPQAPPTNPSPEPSTLGNSIHGRLRWLHCLPLVVSRHATVSTVPRVQGQGRPPGQATGRAGS
jgi:hypothetical protein